ncbi:hypothetical protein H4582DRAFT_400906 [Lactarius indigo]|nr:hypothetical protein H4582DRAFT_400906 [Lactarius indigo]
MHPVRAFIVEPGVISVEKRQLTSKVKTTTLCLEPFPAKVDWSGFPAAVSNVETASVTPTTICRHGSSWFASFGRDRSRDTSTRGQVNSPCIVEVEMRIPLNNLIEKHAEIVRDGWDRSFLARARPRHSRRPNEKRLFK